MNDSMINQDAYIQLSDESKTILLNQQIQAQIAKSQQEKERLERETHNQHIALEEEEMTSNNDANFISSAFNRTHSKLRGGR